MDEEDSENSNSAEGPIQSPVISRIVVIEAQGNLLTTGSEASENVDIEGVAEVIHSEEELHESEESTEEEEENPSKKPRLDITLGEDDGSRCPICMERCQSKSEHRLCMIRCGHYFGESCLKIWLDGKRRRQCPVCRKPFWAKNIRPLFVNRIIAIDVSKKLNLKRDIATLTNEKNNLHLRLVQAMHKRRTLEESIAWKGKEINELINKHNVELENENKSLANLKYQHTFVVNKQGGSRVMDYNQEQNMLAVSTQVSNNVFGDVYGIKQITVSNNKLVNFVTMHQKAIKDIKFHLKNPWILTVSQDKTIQIMNVIGKSSFAKTTVEAPVWSCCWDWDDTNILHTGGQHGNVTSYDLRNFTQPLSVIEMPNDKSPVISVSNFNTNSKSFNICTTLNSVYVINKASDDKITRLPIDGPFVSTSVLQNPETKILISARPNSKQPYARHILCSFNSESEEVPCEIDYTFQGASVLSRLSRSCLYFRKNYFVAAHNENMKTVQLWNAANRECSNSINCDEPVLDICHIQSEFASYLACLSDTKVNFYKFQ